MKKDTVSNETACDPLRPQEDDQLAFLRIMDALQPGIGFVACDGTVLFANRAMRDVVEGGRAGEVLRREIERFVKSLCTQVRALRPEAVPGVEELEVRVVKAEEREYRLRGGYVGLDLFGTGPAILVRLEAPAAARLPEPALRRLFGLTRRESRVAELVAEGHSNAQIARLLFISEHTVRTHVARVLRKVGVRSRAGVRARIYT